MKRLGWFRIGICLLVFATACAPTAPPRGGDFDMDDLRPDYRFQSISVTELTGVAVYSAVMVNTGRTYVYKQEDPPRLAVEATAFYLFPDNRIRYVTQTTQIPNIQGGATQTAGFQFNKIMRLKQPDGRRQTSLATWVMFRIDPENAIFERDEFNNTALMK